MAVLVSHRDEESDSSDEGGGRTLKRKGDSLFDSDFFEAEFRKRRRVSCHAKSWVEYAFHVCVYVFLCVYIHDGGVSSSVVPAVQMKWEYQVILMSHI